MRKCLESLRPFVSFVAYFNDRRASLAPLCTRSLSDSRPLYFLCPYSSSSRTSVITSSFLSHHSAFLTFLETGCTNSSAPIARFLAYLLTSRYFARLGASFLALSGVFVHPLSSLSVSSIVIDALIIGLHFRTRLYFFPQRTLTPQINLEYFRPRDLRTD